MKTRFLIFALLMFSAAKLSAQPGKFESDVIETSGGKLTMYFVGHASLLFDFNGKMIYVDPWNNQTDFSKFPKADLILITHQHYDHMDPKAVDDLSKNGTQIVETKTVFDVLVRGTAMKNGEKKTIDGIGIEAVPAYNTTKGRDIFHPKGRDNGYVLTFGNKKVYVAGDTENVPEMA
jgi:L-ascorbate metabolism protein UlaG (beta-lactamase superfamily)